MTYTLHLTLRTPDAEGMTDWIHTGSDPEELWDLVNLELHGKAKLEDSDGNLVAKYTASEFSDPE